MKIRTKTKKEVDTLREGGKRLAHILHTLSEAVAPGVPAEVLDNRARKLADEFGDTPAFLGYTPKGAKRPYPAAVCVSINDEIVHGIPNEGEKVLRDGDVVTLDMGLVHNNLITDAAVTRAVGEVSEKARTLVTATREALAAAARAVRPGNHVGDIGHAVKTTAESYGLSVFRELVGHGVGYAVHEPPAIPNVGTPGTGAELVPGMVLAIEPMCGLGAGDIMLDGDGYTYRTKDGSLSAHFEHTIVVTENEPEILTGAADE